jgi:pimeloyl-ACP methyl ester carboxylesterase
MVEIAINGTTLVYEEQGDGAPICCVHGVGGSSLAWSAARSQLARRGRVITYDRRGSGRSVPAGPLEKITMIEHALDLLGLLRTLTREPAVIIGRSYGGGVAVQLALAHPERVGALVLLEPAVTGLCADYDRWEREFDAAIDAAAERAGPDAAAEAFLIGVFGSSYTQVLPTAVQEIIRSNAGAIVADCTAPTVNVEPRALHAITAPVLVVAATSSPPALHALASAVASSMANGRLVAVAGSHLIDPAAPEVLAFLDDVLARDRHDAAK